MSEMKSCPFCNGESKLQQSSFSGWTVMCASCGAESSVANDQGSSVTKWNTRTSPWVSVKDKLPEVNTRVITLRPGGFIQEGYLYGTIEGYDKYFIVLSLGIKYDVTHWMLIPELPEVYK